MKPEFIDNREERTLAEALRQLAADPGYARAELDIASGYFNLAGFLEAASVVESRPRFRLLLGAEPEPPLAAAPRTDGTPIGFNSRQGLADLEQQLDAERDRLPFSREAAEQVLHLAKVLQRNEISVRRYLERFLHGKAYIFRGEVVIAGSANFTYGGLVHNRELALAQYQPNVVAMAEAWFDELWEEGEDYRERLIEILTAREQQTWTPHDIYLRALLELYGDELELLRDEEGGFTPGQPGGITLTDFQRHGLRRALRILERFDGVLVGDGVGLGKSFIGTGLLGHYVKREKLHALVIVPAALRDSFWQRYLEQEQIPARVVSYQQLASDAQLGGDTDMLRLDKDFYRFVLVDEAHAFRNPDTDQYRALSRLMGGSRKKLALMTATPVNNSIRDLYHQLMLFARHTAHFAPLGIPDLNLYFREAERAAAHGDSASAMFKLIDATSVRRTRRFIQRHYPNAQIDGKPIAFPEARLRTTRYDLDDAYPGLFAHVALEIDDNLSLARYRPDDFRLDGIADRRAQTIAGLLRTSLLKRFESSVHAFRLTVEKLITDHEAFLLALDSGGVLVPGSKRSRGSEAEDPAELVDELGLDSLPASEYKVEELRTAIVSDLEILRGFHERVVGAGIDDDPKLEALGRLLSEELGPEKAIVFTYYADTADWIAQALEAHPERFGARRQVVVTGTQSETAAHRLRRVHEFAPKTTLEEAGSEEVRAEDEKDLLIATDVLSEGQNLQQARYIVNYDMPWNPMRLVQRNGRIDRLGSPFAGQEIYLYNLFPEGELEAILNLYDRLSRKIGHANISVGMEAPVFEEAAAVERNFADVREQIESVAAEDVAILEEAEARLDAFSGEEFRMDLRTALAAQRLAELRGMPHGAGSGFRTESLRSGAVGVFFGARVLLGPRLEPSSVDQRAWRYVDLGALDEQALADELEILRRIRCAFGEPRDLPEIASTLYELWDRVQGEILADYAERLDPAQGGIRIPASQEWAIELLAASDALLARRDVPASVAREAAQALSVPRSPLVMRRLSSLRKELQAGDTTQLAAALGVLEVVADEGLRPPEGDDSQPPALTRERIRLICYQVVHC
jgi:PLD-like domain/Helicase conserved C-terminal domain/SNF2-related domain